MYSSKFVSIFLLFTSLILTACGGGGGSDDSSGNSVVNSVFSGSVGDGPIVGALVTIYDNNGGVIDTTSSSSSANYQVNIRTGRKSFPLSLHATGGTDIVSNNAPDFTLISVALSPADKKNININPYSTFIVKTAAYMGEVNDSNVELATQHVLNALNFGLDTSRITDPLTIELDETTIANFIKATEVLGEMVRRTKQALQTQNINLSADALINHIASDLIDGKLDGIGTPSTDPRITATWNLIVADVGLEAMVNRLMVNGNVATNALDNAIMTSLPDVPAGTTTGTVTINDNLINMVIASVQAAQTITTDTNLANLESILSGLPANASPSEIDALLSASHNQSVDNIVTQLSNINEIEVATINETITNSNTTPDQPIQPTQVDPVVMVSSNADLSNAQPLDGATIEGNVYIFFQEGSDWSTKIVREVHFYCCFGGPDAHESFPYDFESPYVLNIDLSNYDSNYTHEFYASVYFETQTTPEEFFAYFNLNDIGTTTPANFAPTINGTPAATVLENSTYSFMPTANDSEGDSLTFSIQNKPAWANFNTTTGELSGIPGTVHVGSYSNIIITVSDGNLFSSLPSFNIEVTSVTTIFTGSATINWIPPTEYSNGSSLTDISGYKIRYGTSPGNYPNVIHVENSDLTSYVVNNLQTNSTYYFVMTTIDGNGLESNFSNIITRTIQ